MIIDCHNHPDWHGHNLDKFLANMEANNIDQTWLLTWECPADEYDQGGYGKCVTPGGGPDGPMPFNKCLSYVERAPGKFVLGYAPDPRVPGAIDRLQSAIDIYGVQVCGEVKLRMMLDDWDAVRMWRFCGEKGVPVTVHIDYEFSSSSRFPRPNYWYGGGIEAFERAIAACPDTIFLGHAPGFWAHISGDGQFDKVAYPKGPVEPGGKLVDMMRTYPNLYCDMSAGSGRNALSRDPDFGKQFILEFKDRILYGRDYFDSQHQEFLNSLDLPQDVLDLVYWGNAKRLVP